MSNHIIYSFVAFVLLISLSTPSEANMSYTPYIHELVQEGENMEVRLQVFEDASLNVTKDVPLPGIDSQYTLTRWTPEIPGVVTVFENKVFSKDDADSVTAYECQTLDPWFKECKKGNYCIDCDGDGVNECAGFCAVAYRFSVVDECVPEGQVYYSITSPDVEGPGLVTGENHAFLIEGEGLGSTNGSVTEHGVDCSVPDDSRCNVATVGDRPGARVNLLKLLVQLGAILY